jgi:hypothetical protein
MPLIVKSKGKVVCKPERPVLSRLWQPKPPPKPMSLDACRIQRALIAAARELATTD